MGRKTLSAEKHAERKALYDKRLSDGQIAKQLNLHRNTIHCWRKRRNLSPNFNSGSEGVLTEEKKRIIADLNKQGFNDVEISEKIGRSTANVRYFRHNSGLPVNPHRRSHRGKQKTIDFEAPIINFYYQHRDLTWKQIGDAVGVKPSKVRLIVGEHLMRVCRAEEECPYKALLPEYGLEEEENHDK